MPEEQEGFIPSADEIERAVTGALDGGAAATATAPEPEELSELTPDEKEIGLRIMPKLVAKISAQANATAAKKVAESIQQLNEQNRKMMTDEVEKLRKAMKPPDPQELEKLLSQVYGSMDVEIVQRNKEIKRFTIRELPQEAEQKLFAIVAKRIVPHLKELSTIEWTASATYAQKITKGLAVIPDALDMMAECAVICLNPYGEEAIDLSWVQKNIGSTRILNIVKAQMEVSKLRDFFSEASQLLRQ